jgi:hypothetical protein
MVADGVTARQPSGRVAAGVDEGGGVEVDPHQRRGGAAGGGGAQADLHARGAIVDQVHRAGDAGAVGGGPGRQRRGLGGERGAARLLHRRALLEAGGDIGAAQAEVGDEHRRALAAERQPGDAAVDEGDERAVVAEVADLERVDVGQAGVARRRRRLAGLDRRRRPARPAGHAEARERQRGDRRGRGRARNGTDRHAWSPAFTTKRTTNRRTSWRR